MLEKWSKRAERIRETRKNRFLAERVSYAIWLVVEMLARLAGDWKRVVDVKGQRALFFRELGRLKASFGLLRECYLISLSEGDNGLRAVYLGEMAWVDSLLGNHDQAEGSARMSLELARDPKNGVLDSVCRRLRKLGQILIRAGKIEEARAPLEEAAKIALDEGQPIAHVVHRVEALIELARYILVYSNGDPKNGWEYLEKALSLAKGESLMRQVERIEELRMDRPMAGGMN